MSAYIPHHAPSVLKAKELSSGLSQQKRYKAITSYINRSFVYDYIKAATVKKYGVFPDIASCWERHMGICGDLAALAVEMLNAAGVNAKYVTGKADGIPHAWVKSSYGIYDPTAEITKKTPKRYRQEKIE